jgi:hypothetical protein
MKLWGSLRWRREQQVRKDVTQEDEEEEEEEEQ